jgi:hypothetical protein
MIAGAAIAAVAVALIVGIGAGGTSGNPVAAAVNVHASDLPGSGWHVQIPGGAVTISKPASSAMLHCLGLKTAANLGVGQSVASPTFVDGSGAGTDTVVSTVTVVGSQAAVMRNLALAANPRFTTCAAEEQANTGHVTSGPAGAVSMSAIHIALLPFAAAGTDGGYGELTTGAFHVTGSNESLAAYDTSYTFGVGRIFISLSVNTFGRPANTPLVQQVYERIITRALAQPH